MGTSNQISTYQNVMEQVAAREVKRQLQNHPSEVVRSTDRDRAIAYALNRLPPLYTTTQEGWYWHHQRATTSLADAIARAATRGIREAQQKTPSFPTPLRSRRDPERVLEKLQELLGCDVLTWRNLPEAIETAIQQAEELRNMRENNRPTVGVKGPIV